MDFPFLEPVFAVPGPYATVCADVTHTTENADTELELRVRAVAEKLAEQGAPEPVVEAVRTSPRTPSIRRPRRAGPRVSGRPGRRRRARRPPAAR